MLSLDTRDEKLNLSVLNVRTLPLLFCWRCPLSEGFSYKLSEDKIELITFNKGRVWRNFPYEKYPDYFPSAYCRLVKIPIKSQMDITIRNSIYWQGLDSSSLEYRYNRKGAFQQLMWPRHQIGGEPFFWGSNPGSLCLLCKKPQEFLAAIADENLDERGFVNYDPTQTLFWICKKCKVISAYNETD